MVSFWKKSVYLFVCLHIKCMWTCTHSPCPHMRTWFFLEYTRLIGCSNISSVFNAPLNVVMYILCMKENPCSPLSGKWDVLVNGPYTSWMKDSPMSCIPWFYSHIDEEVGILQVNARFHPTGIGLNLGINMDMSNPCWSVSAQPVVYLLQTCNISMYLPSSARVRNCVFSPVVYH